MQKSAEPGGRVGMLAGIIRAWCSTHAIRFTRRSPERSLVAPPGGTHQEARRALWKGSPSSLEGVSTSKVGGGVLGAPKGGVRQPPCHPPGGAPPTPLGGGSRTPPMGVTGRLRTSTGEVLSKPLCCRRSPSSWPRNPSGTPSIPQGPGRGLNRPPQHLPAIPSHPGKRPRTPSMAMCTL